MRLTECPQPSARINSASLFQTTGWFARPLPLTTHQDSQTHLSWSILLLTTLPVPPSPTGHPTHMAASLGVPDTGAGLGGRGAAAAGMEAARETCTATSNWIYDDNSSNSSSSTADTCSGSATCVLTFLHDKIQALALLLLSVQLAYLLLDRVGKWCVARMRRTTKSRAATPTTSSSQHKQPMLFASPSVFMTSPRPSSSTQVWAHLCVCIFFL